MLKKNTIANYLGQGWAALMGLVFIPYYVHYLGVESYGLIGLFTLMQGWFVILDMGMAPTLSREMARFKAGAHTAQSIRDLLRSLEYIGFAIGIVVTAVLIAAAAFIVNSWLNLETLNRDTATLAVSIMGAIIALRFIENFYRSSLLGLQQQVTFNILHAGTATLRAGGAVLVLALISPSITAFFLWQLLTSLCVLATFAYVTYRKLPKPEKPSQFSSEALKKVWKYAGGMLGITFLSLLLMQVDKLMLSKLLTLEEYGAYSLAVIAAAGLFTLTTPIAQAWFPRLTHMVVTDDQQGLADTFHKGAKLVAVIVGGVASYLFAFSEPILTLWLQDAALAEQITPVFRLLLIGNFLNCLMWIPYQTQLAHGWTSLAIYLNIFAVSLLVPVILYVVPIYGTIGAAYVWVTLNAFYVLVGVQIMFSRILKNEKWQWYLSGIIIPISAILSVNILINLIYLYVNSNSKFGYFILFSCLILLLNTIFAIKYINIYLFKVMKK